MADRLGDLAGQAEAHLRDLDAFILAPDLSEALYSQAEQAVADMFEAVQAEPLWLYLFHGDLDDLRFRIGLNDHRHLRSCPRNGFQPGGNAGSTTATPGC